QQRDRRLAARGQTAVIARNSPVRVDLRKQLRVPDVPELGRRGRQDCLPAAADAHGQPGRQAGPRADQDVPQDLRDAGPIGLRKATRWLSARHANRGWFARRAAAREQSSRSEGPWTAFASSSPCTTTGNRFVGCWWSSTPWATQTLCAAGSCWWMIRPLSVHLEPGQSSVIRRWIG